MILSEFESDSSWSSRLAAEEQVGQHMRTYCKTLIFSGYFYFALLAGTNKNHQHSRPQKFRIELHNKQYFDAQP